MTFFLAAETRYKGANQRLRNMIKVNACNDHLRLKSLLLAIAMGEDVIATSMTLGILRPDKIGHQESLIKIEFEQFS